MPPPMAKSLGTTRALPLLWMATSMPAEKKAATYAMNETGNHGGIWLDDARQTAREANAHPYSKKEKTVVTTASLPLSLFVRWTNASTIWTAPTTTEAYRYTAGEICTKSLTLKVSSAARSAATEGHQKGPGQWRSHGPCWRPLDS